jgi:hypothetical protein
MYIYFLEPVLPYPTYCVNHLGMSSLYLTVIIEETAVEGPGGVAALNSLPQVERNVMGKCHVICPSSGSIAFTAENCRPNLVSRYSPQFTSDPFENRRNRFLAVYCSV